MRVEVDEPARGVHRMSGGSWRAVMAMRACSEKLRGNPAPRSSGDDDMGGLRYTYVYLSPLMFEPQTVEENLSKKKRITLR